jgi:small subunit ribosomal protein S9
MEVINAIGRRKTAVARVYLSEGKGNITINKRELNEYFPVGTLQFVVQQPLHLCEVAGKYDIKVNLDGGGLTGQAEALRLGISRALLKINTEEYRPRLKAAGFLTRDPREVERKKPGRPKARKRFQFSKR